MQHAQSRARSLRWILRGGLAGLAAVAALAVSAGPACAGGVMVGAGPAAGVVRQLGGGEPGRGHGGRRDLHGG